MSTQTTHLHLDLRESTDIFNPLSTNANFESLDNIIYQIQNKGGVPTYTTTASANLLKLSDNPTSNSTVFKFVAAGDADRWSFSEAINDIVALDGSKKTVKGGNMYVAWVNSANAMVVIAWPDVVNAQTFDGKGPAEWATAVQLQAVNTAASNAAQTAQAAATVANNALEVANAAGFKPELIFTGDETVGQGEDFVYNLTKPLSNYKFLLIVFNPYYSFDNNKHYLDGSIVPIPTDDRRISISAFGTLQKASGNLFSTPINRWIGKRSETSLASVGLNSTTGVGGDNSGMQIVYIYGVK